MTENQYKTISAWQNKIFTKATPMTAAFHLEEEVKELLQALRNDNDQEIREEIADCFLLLIGVCNKYGLTYHDIISIIDEKMLINLSREWGQPNEKGYVKHKA